MSYDASDRRHVKEAYKASKVAAAQARSVLKTIMSTPSGRQWIWEWLERCHVFSSSHTSNALNTAFAEGERNVGLGLMAQIMSVSPDQWILAMREADARDRTAESRRDRADRDGGDSEPDSSNSNLLTADERARIEALDGDDPLN